MNRSALASVHYLPALRLLEVEFHFGLLYQYSDVPQHTELLAAESKGTYFNANIRNRLSYKQIDNTSRSGHARRPKI